MDGWMDEKVRRWASTENIGLEKIQAQNVQECLHHKILKDIDTINSLPLSVLRR